MYILTHAFTLLATDASGQTFMQAKTLAPEGGARLIDIDMTEAGRLGTTGLMPGEPGPVLQSGPLAGFHYVKTATPGLFHLFRNGFLCALPNQTAVADAKAASTWETFKFVTVDVAAKYLGVHTRREESLAGQVRALTKQKAPICLNFGIVPRRIEGFLTIARKMFLAESAAAAFHGSPEACFLFDFVEMSWPIPDASVDYIFSEDFVARLPQRSQVAFLAEAFRVLKPGGYHRLTTPCLAAALRRHSDFAKGRDGVSFSDFDTSGQVALMTRGLLTEVARAIGYREVFFTARSRGSSPHAVEDRRPAADRDPDTGTIFADLLR